MEDGQTGVDMSSANEDYIDIDVGESGAGMSDGEIKSELEGMKRYANPIRDISDCTKIEESKATSKTPLATPKLMSVVVIPETASKNCSERPGFIKTVNSGNKVQRRKHHRNNSAKKADNKAEGSIAALLSKITMTGKKASHKPTDKEAVINYRNATPNKTKRVRSTVSSPEGLDEQPGKLAKMQNREERETRKDLSFGDQSKHETLNLKISNPNKPLSGKELQIIKKFLQHVIEQALEHQEEFIPIFTEPCKIEKDGVYFYCSDQKCARWICLNAKTGIPGISGKLVALPQEEQLQFDPEFVNVRVVSIIPTKLPKGQILKNLARMNGDLNTEKWRIGKTIPKGSTSSKVYMRMDKHSFDAICARNNKVNWILGPIDIFRETRNPKQKEPNPNGGHTRNERAELTGIDGRPYPDEE